MIPSQLVPSANHLWQSTLFAGDEITAPSIDSVLGKLGLRLERAKGHRDFLVIDHVEKPSEN